MHVLVCDDDPVTRFVITRRVARLPGCRVSECADGGDALDIILGGGIDLLILDVNMPEVGGLQVLETVRRSREFGHLPVILLSSEARQEIVAELVKKGVLGYLLKPVQPARLAALLEQARSVHA